MRLIDADAYANNLLAASCELSGEYEEGLHEAWEIVNSETGAPTVNAIIIPENATNGDMIKIMFPYIRVNEYLNSVDVIKLDGMSVFSKEWWYAPYKRGEKK